MVSNSHSIISLNDSGFDQLLTLYNVGGSTPVFPNIRDQAPWKDQGKGVKNLVGWVENVVEVQDNGNTKNMTLENSIGDKHASIDIAVALENGFVDEAIEIFTE